MWLLDERKYSFLFELVIAVAQVLEDASEYGVKGPFERIRKYEADMFCYASYGKAGYEPAAVIESGAAFVSV